MVVGSNPTPPIMVQRGDVAEVEVAAALMSRGFPVSKPLTDNEPYDLVVEIDLELQKVQVKRMYKEEERNSLKTNLYKSGEDFSQNRTTYSSEEVDAFAFYYNGEIYWSWYSETPDSTINLSLKDESEVLARHKPRTRFAEDHKLDRKL